MNKTRNFKLGAFLVCPQQLTIQYAQQEAEQLRPKIIEILCFLVSRYPEVVTREELIEHVWNGNQLIGDKSLTNTVWHLRQFFNQHHAKDARQKDIVETVRSIGYKLNVSPEFIDEKDEQTTLNPSPIRHNKVNLFVVVSTLVTMFFIGFLTHHFSSHQTLPVARIKHLTKAPGSEYFVAPSPNGKKAVFLWRYKKRNQLFLKHIDEPDLHWKQLTFEKRQVGRAVWAPTRDKIYYTVKDDHLCEIRALSLEKLTPLATSEKVTDCAIQSGYDYIDISPDGHFLIFHGKEENERYSGLYIADLRTKPALINRYSCIGSCPYRDRDMAFSPDGKKLAVTRRNNYLSEHMYVIDLDTQQQQQLTNQAEDIVGITWSADSQKIIYGSQVADKRQGYILDIDSGQTITLDIEGFNFPRSVNDGRVFFQKRRERYFIAGYSMQNEVPPATEYFIESEYSHLYPHFSPASQQVVYVSNETGFYELWVADADGRNRRQLTQLNKNIRHPAWSNDGQQIAFIAQDEAIKGHAVYIYDINERTVRQLSTTFTNLRRLSWSLDNRQLITSPRDVENPGIYAIEIKTGKATQLLAGSARSAYMLDENTLLYSNYKGLWQGSLDANLRPTLLLSTQDFSSPYSWSLHQQSVYFVHRNQNIAELRALDLTDLSTTRLFSLPQNQLKKTSSVAVLPQNHKVLINQNMAPQSDLFLLEHPMLMDISN